MISSTCNWLIRVKHVFVELEENFDMFLKSWLIDWLIDRTLMEKSWQSASRSWSVLTRSGCRIPPPAPSTSGPLSSAQRYASFHLLLKLLWCCSVRSLRTWVLMTEACLCSVCFSVVWLCSFLQPSLGVSMSNSALLYVLTGPVGPYYPTGFKPVSLLADPKFVRAWEGGCGAFKMGA